MFSYQSTPTEEQAILAEGNQYTCDVCKKSFALRTTFRRHWLTHQQGSQNSCNVCDKSFYDKSGLKRHQCMHTGQFSCSVCNKSYSNQSGLKQHHQHVHVEV